ncbi:hypothetical protein ACP3T3_01355 [Chryseobacterium sp. CBSDS_008]|uniref:hypothetical protein n=1 Tax=Chryseobacterium sp. CBSDS_008 TaxID=3415265 RepID=UPI003CEE8708
MKEEDYHNLIGKSSHDVFNELGHYYYNFSHPTRWIYKLKDPRLKYGFMYIYFDINNIVCEVKISKKYKTKWWNLFKK